MGIQNVEQFNFTSSIKNNDDEEMFIILQSYFGKIQHIDKYLRATVSSLFSLACKKIYKDKMPDKISQKNIIKIQEKVTRGLRLKCGKWISFRLKWNKRRGFRFSTNFNSTYKTSKGKLYGHGSESPLKSLFYTGHALDRFNNRVKHGRYNDFYKTYKRKYGVYPTAADLLDQLVMFSCQYGIRGDDRFLNVQFGVLIIETYKGLHIVKTFLTPDMISTDDGPWVELALTIYEEKERDGRMYIGDIDGLFEHKTTECEPEFLSDDEHLPVEASIALAKGIYM